MAARWSSSAGTRGRKGEPVTNIAMRIATHARALGVRPGGVLLVHSSLKSLCEPGATPDDVIDGLLAALDGGTLVLPTLSYMHVGPAQRRFNARTTPSNVGAIPEYFRVRRAQARSLCPTHSCAALGPDAVRITRGQQQDTTPCGAHSPLRRVMELNGQILFLGCGADCNTSMHAVEELAPPDYLFADSYEYELTDFDGAVYHMNCRAHGFDGVVQRYSRVLGLMPAGTLREGGICAARCQLLDAPAMWEAAAAMYRRAPHYFVDYIEAASGGAGHAADNA